MRFEERGDEVRIIQPSAERVAERQNQLFSAALIGLPGSAFLWHAWLSGEAPAKSLATGVAFSLISAWAFWKAERTRDAVWSVTLNRAKRTLELPRGVVTSFDEVSVVRSSMVEYSEHALTLMVERGHGSREILLCHMVSKAEDQAAFEAAAEAIAQAIGARHESRSYASRCIGAPR